MTAARLLLTSAVFALAVAYSVSSASNNGGGALVCPERWGKPGEPLVKTPQVAKAIFLAVERDFFPGADRENFPTIEAEDEGEFWGVFRSTMDDSVRGGGQLTMRIAKCDGAISDVYFTR